MRDLTAYAIECMTELDNIGIQLIQEQRKDGGNARLFRADIL